MSKIENLTLEDVMGDRFARYSKSIIQERALPDIRDGLKPVQRRILYAMNKDGNTYDKGFRKSAKSVGNVMGNFHPHGDSSIYEALVRMSQDWKVREPLIEMHGNNGSMDGDPPAAMRYTEARLSKIAGEMLRDIDQETVDWVLNFDDTEYEPTVLPSRFPNLLVNGSTGISSGYATDIPPHNLGEVIDAILYLQKHPDATVQKLMEFVVGPDFPTGGIVQGIDGIKQAYETGHGRVVVRSKTEIKPLRGNKSQIVITEIPYEVNKAQLVKRIDEIRINKKIDGIAEVRDESDREGLTVVVELKRDVDSTGILNYLFKNTDLQVSYTFNMVAINHMRPERVSLKTMLTSYLEFQQEVIKKRTVYDLKKAQDRQHIVEGLIKALSILDEVIKTIRASQNRKDARDNLVKTYDFSTVQADAIVALQLYRLTNTDVTQLEKEAEELAKRIAADQLIINDDNELNKVLAKELRQIAKDFRQPRVSEIQAEVSDLKISKTVTVPDEDVVVLVSQQGYLKRSSIRSYTASNGEEDGLQDFDHPVFLDKVNTRDHLMIFTSKGNLIYRPVVEISDVRWKDTGEHLSQTVGLDNDELVIAVYSFKSLKETGEFLVATDDGYIKRVAFDSLTPGRTYKKHSFVFEKLKSDQAKVVSLMYLPQPDEKASVMLISHLGYALRFGLDEIPVNGARTTGVKSMNLKSDWVVGAQLVKDGQSVGIITQRGAFKKMAVNEVSPTSRAKRGVLVLRELKNDPHRIIGFVAIEQADAPLVVYTDHSKEHDILPNEFNDGGRYSNGSFVIDVDSEGQPSSIQPKLLELIIN